MEFWLQIFTPRHAGLARTEIFPGRTKAGKFCYQLRLRRNKLARKISQPSKSVQCKVVSFYPMFGQTFSHAIVAQARPAGSCISKISGDRPVGILQCQSLLPARKKQRRNQAVRWGSERERDQRDQRDQRDILGGAGEHREERLQCFSQVWAGLWGRECWGETGEAWCWSEQIRNTGEESSVPNCHWYIEGRRRI